VSHQDTEPPLRLSRIQRFDDPSQGVKSLVAVLLDCCDSLQRLVYLRHAFFRFRQALFRFDLRIHQGGNLAVV
jgi:hypothetical protein